MSHTKTRAFAISSVFTLSVLALGLALYPSASISAESSGGAEVGATIGEFLKLAVDTSNLVLKDGNNNTSITPSASGTLVTGDVNVAVTTNTVQGYSLSIYTADSSTSMTSTSSSASIGSISSATGYDATTGLSSLAANTWGFRKNTGTAQSPAYTNWFGIGADNTHAVTIEETNGPNSSYCNTLSYPLVDSGCASGSYNEYNLNFGANPTSALPAGTYINNVVISAVAKSEGPKYAVNFNSNGGNNTMGSRTIVKGSTFTLPATSNVVKEGYTIAGYAFTSAGPAAYTPGQTVQVNDFLTAATTAGQDPDSGITLYIIWAEPISYMQDFSCSSLADGESTTLVDKRDNAEYTVKKFGTGTNAECWMTSNLKLGYDKGYTLTNELTNIPDNDRTTYYLPQAGYRGSVTNSSTLSSTTSATFDTAAVSEAHIQYRAAGTADNDSGNAVPEDTGYYNYPAVSLGASYYNGGSSSGDIITRDICPKGWRLPRGSSAYIFSSFYWLDAVAFGGDGSNRRDTTTMDKYLNQASFGYTGYYNSASLYSVGSNGYWWSSTVRDSISAYGLSLNSYGDVYPQGYGNMYLGYAVRCVAKETRTLSDLTYMQDINADIVSNTPANAIKTLTDSRDNHQYKVKKLPDGKIWMIQNLTLTATDLVTNGKALTNADTNIPASDNNSYYIPPQNKRYATANSITNANVASDSATTTVNFDTSYSNQPQVAYKAAGDTNHDTGNALPEDTAWYPFYTATLGFSYYQDGKTSGSSTRDICPKSWHLPWTSDSGTTRQGSAEFYKLALAYNNNSGVWSNYIAPTSSSTSSPNSSDPTIRQNMVYGDSGSLNPNLDTNGAAGFTYAGYYGSTTLYNVGTYGYYWSSSVYNTNYSYGLYFSTSNVSPQSYSGKYDGRAVRCVTGS